MPTTSQRPRSSPVNGSEPGKLAVLDAGDRADVRAAFPAGGVKGADPPPLPACVVPPEPEVVLPPPPADVVALGPEAVPPDCKTPVEPVALSPPPT